MTRPSAESLGTGEELVLLHGWGLHGGVWRDTAGALSQRARSTLVDLPGHGASPMPAGGYTLTALAAAVETVLPPRCTLVGWSLGGMVALELARSSPARVARLVLVASTPQFFADEHWPYALKDDVLEGFARELAGDYHGTVRRFLALQVMGTEHERRTLTRLRHQLSAAPPQPQALAGGLEILRGATLLETLPALELPVALIHGERDRLVPPAAGTAAAGRLPQAELHVIPGAGHAPFLSHAEAFLEILTGFIDGRRT